AVCFRLWPPHPGTSAPLPYTTLFRSVLAEVALLTGSSDPRGDLRATLGRQVLQFGLELLVSVLGQPDRLGGVFSHRDSLGDLGNFGGKFPTGADRPQWRSERWRPTGKVWVCRH